MFAWFMCYVWVVALFVVTIVHTLIHSQVPKTIYMHEFTRNSSTGNAKSPEIVLHCEDPPVYGLSSTSAVTWMWENMTTFNGPIEHLNSSWLSAGPWLPDTPLKIINEVFEESYLEEKQSKNSWTRQPAGRGLCYSLANKTAVFHQQPSCSSWSPNGDTLSVRHVLSSFRFRGKPMVIATNRPAQSDGVRLTGLYIIRQLEGVCSYELLGNIGCDSPNKIPTNSQHFTLATAADVDYDDSTVGGYRLMLYATFAGRPTQYRTEWLLCSFDVTGLVEFQAERSQLHGSKANEVTRLDIPVKLATVIFSEDEPQDVLAFRVDNQTLVLYRNMKSVYVTSQLPLLERQKSGLIFTTNSLRSFNGPRGMNITAIMVNHRNARLTILTDNKLFNMNWNGCHRYTTCQDCLTSNQPFCGWCILENRCSIRQTCSHEKIQSDKQGQDYWREWAGRCPRVYETWHSRPLHAALAGSKHDQLANFTLIHYPDFNRSNLTVVCEFSGLFQPAKITTAKWLYRSNDPPDVECTMPNDLSAVNQLGPFYASTTVTIRVESLILANTSMVIYKDCLYLSCKVSLREIRDCIEPVYRLFGPLAKQPVPPANPCQETSM